MAMDISVGVLLPIVRLVTGRPDAVVDGWQVAPVPHRIENMTTHALDRLTGTLADGTPWSVFAKTLHPASDAPLWHLVPDEHRASVLEDLDWLGEARVYRSTLAADVPPGVRLPAVWRIDETASRLTIWMEDVGHDQHWDLDRYHRTALALGRLAGRWPEARTTSVLGLGRRRLDRLFFGKICHVDLPRQADDAFWRDPAVATAVDDRHRADLARLAGALPHLLERLDRLPHGLAHGDATPDNLREPGDETVVAIDWSYGGCGALGSDLGQLLAGRVESGAAHPEQLPEVAETVFAGYLEGLAAEGCTVEPQHVEEAWATHLAVRSVFSALVVDHRQDLCDDDRRDLLARRATLGRFGLDLAARVAARHAAPRR